MLKETIVEKPGKSKEQKADLVIQIMEEYSHLSDEEKADFDVDEVAGLINLLLKVMQLLLLINYRQ